MISLLYPQFTMEKWQSSMKKHTNPQWSIRTLFHSNLNSENIWFVFYGAPWCHHCQNLKPIWDELAKSLSVKMNFGKVDRTLYPNICTSRNIKGYPTLILSRGSKNEYDYSDERTFDKLKQFALVYAKSALNFSI